MLHFGNFSAVQIASMIFPEDLTEKAFGDNDPTRYGTGIVGIEQIVTPFIKTGTGDFDINDWTDLALTYMLPGGGKQISRTIKGAQDIKRGGSYTDKGQLRFPIDGAYSKAQTLMFGAYSTKAGQEYLETLKPMSDKNTKIYDYLINNTYAGNQNKTVMYKMLKGLTDYRKEIGKTQLSHEDIEEYINKKSVIKGYAPEFRKKVIELLKKDTKDIK